MKYHRWYYEKDIFFRNASSVSMAEINPCANLKIYRFMLLFLQLTPLFFSGPPF